MDQIKKLSKATIFIGGLCIGLLIGIIFISKYKKSDCVVDIETEKGQNISEIWVDVQGAVQNPGVYKLSQNLRVGEALNLAGGVSLSASPKWFSKNINLSQRLEDGDKIYIPYKWEVYKSEEGYLMPMFFEKAEAEESSEIDLADVPENISGDSATGLINVNSAAIEDLETLSGIGPAYAKKIVDNRPYSDLSDLIEKSGVPESTLTKLQEQISF